MPLNEFQTEFKNLMLRPRVKLNEGSEYISKILHDDHIPTSDRLSVYHNNIIGSLSASLCATFPMIENLVGEEFLKEMSRAFVFKHPPQNAVLHHYGEGFSDFIKTYEPARGLPYLSDVARFEWAINHAYYAEDDFPLPADALAKISNDKLTETVLNLRASATLIKSNYPLIDLWNFCLNNHPAPDMSVKNDHYVIVYRPALDVQFVPLLQDEYAFLSALNREPLGQALEITVEDHPNFNFVSFLQKHISMKTLATT